MLTFVFHLFCPNIDIFDAFLFILTHTENYLDPFGLIWTHLESFGPIWTHLDPFHETYVNVHNKEYAPLHQNRDIFLYILV